jgi:hypothetical protein
MKPSTLVPLLSKAFRNNRKVLIKSAPGVGKSELVTLAAKQAEADLVLMHPAVSDPTDFKGMPAVVKDKTGSVAEFLPFGNLRKLVEAKGLTVCFMDDLGQAPHAVQAALMQLIQAREIDGQKISDDVVFVGATNDSSHMAGVTSILEPVKSRWHAIVSLEADLDDWLKWALSPAGNMPPEVVAFTRLRQAFLAEPFKPTKDLTNSPSPRTIASAGDWVRIGVDDREVLAGAVGEAWTGEFLSFLKVFRSMPDLDGIIANPKSAPLPSGHDASLRMALCTALAYRADARNFADIITYLTRIPKEYEVYAVRDAVARNVKLGETRAYTDWSLANTSVMS